MTISPPATQDANQIDGVTPVESPMTRRALIEAYKALGVLDESGLLDFIAEAAHDTKAADQARFAIQVLLDSMSPNLLCTILPAHTEIRFATDLTAGREPQTGLLRDGAWGLYPDERTDEGTERRITTNGWEIFVNPDTVFTYFEVVKMG